MTDILRQKITCYVALLEVQITSETVSSVDAWVREARKEVLKDLLEILEDTQHPYLCDYRDTKTCW